MVTKQFGSCKELVPLLDVLFLNTRCAVLLKYCVNYDIYTKHRN